MDTLVRIYCGRNIPGTNKTLTKAEFEFFVNDVIVPLYQGFTIIEATGFWNGKAEKTFIIEIFTNNELETDCKVSQIAETYVSRYHQEAVAVTKQEIEVKLYTSDTKALQTA
jgi:hypothetical protein